MDVTDTILARWSLTAQDLTKIIDDNPSLRGFLFGYVGEFKLRHYLSSDPRVTDLRKYDDHDRTNKNDLCVTYRGHQFTFEVKSLQSLSVKLRDEQYVGVFQCDASDRREVQLPNGERVNTTNLVVDEFDIVAVNLFQFRKEWAFGFAHNRNLPRTTSKKYPLEQRQYLLKSSIGITWPLQEPFVSDPFTLLDQLLQEREAR